MSQQSNSPPQITSNRKLQIWRRPWGKCPPSIPGQKARKDQQQQQKQDLLLQTAPWLLSGAFLEILSVQRSQHS
eukprot:426172-Prorocentrum_lima.AAC.1